MTANAWGAFYWGDYIADTGHLTLAQHGAYLLLMAHYYRTRRPLPANADQLHRVCRCTNDADRAAVDEVLAEFFSLDGDGYRQSRIDRELAKAIDISEKRRAAANAKHQKSRMESPAFVDACVDANAQQVQTQPQPQPQKDKKPSAALASAATDIESVDPRHAPIRSLIQELHQHAFLVKCQWDGSEGKHLDRLLAANPGWTEEELARMARNRFASDGITPDRPRKWLPNLGSYAVGPHDRFNKLREPSGVRRWEGLQTGASPAPEQHEQLEYKLPPDLDEEAGCQIWSATFCKLSKRVNQHSCNTWLRPLEPAGIRENVLYLKLPTRDFVDVRKKYGSLLSEVLPELKVEFVFPEAVAC